MRFIATTGVTLLILVAVLLPGSKIPDVGFTGVDKLAHIVLFGTWIIVVRFDFGSSYRWIAAFLIGALFSLFTEVLQILVEGRTFDYYDVLADGVGLISGALLGKTTIDLIRKWFVKLPKF